MKRILYLLFLLLSVGCTSGIKSPIVITSITINPEGQRSLYKYYTLELRSVEGNQCDKVYIYTDSLHKVGEVFYY